MLDRCRCTPYYHWGVVDLPTILEDRPFCKGPSLLCMNEVFGQLGEYNHIKQEGDNVTRVPCLAACEDQLNLGWMRAAVANIHSLHQHANADMHSAACFALVAGLV